VSLPLLAAIRIARGRKLAVDLESEYLPEL
jgi:hypothetical protein